MSALSRRQRCNGGSQDEGPGDVIKKFYQKFLTKNFFWPKILFHQKKILIKNVFWQRFFLNKIFFWPIFFTKRNVDQIFLQKKLLTNFYTKKRWPNFFYKLSFLPNNFFDQIFLWPKLFFDQKRCKKNFQILFAESVLKKKDYWAKKSLTKDMFAKFFLTKK